MCVSWVLRWNIQAECVFQFHLVIYRRNKEYPSSRSLFVAAMIITNTLLLIKDDFKYNVKQHQQYKTVSYEIMLQYRHFLTHVKQLIRYEI